MHAIEVAQTGGPEVLKYVERPKPSPPDEVLIQADAIGVNYIDTYFRSGQYPRELPFVLGMEVCGTVAAVGDDVAAIKAGDRGGHRERQRRLRGILHGASRFRRLCARCRAVRCGGLSVAEGMTAHYLIKSVYPVQPRDFVLVHAGAGGWA